MSIRTSPNKVRDVLGITANPNVDIYIQTASVLVDKVAACAGSKLSDDQLAIIETWLAAHFYTVTNAQLQSKGIGGASKSWFQGELGKKLEATLYGQQALAMDTSGCLELLTGETVTLTWVGSDEEDYDADWNS